MNQEVVVSVGQPLGDEKFAVIEQRLNDVEHNVIKMCRPEEPNHEMTESHGLKNRLFGSCNPGRSYTRGKYPPRRSPSPQRSSQGNLSSMYFLKFLL